MFNSSRFPSSMLFNLEYSSELRTFYVDNTLGNDAWNGRSQATAWKTLAKVNASTFYPDDSILFKCGEVWSGATALIILISGQYLHPINYSNYGVGPLPIIANTTAGTNTVRLEANYITIRDLDIRGVACNAIDSTLNWATGADGEGIFYCVIDGVTTRGPIYIFGQHNIVQNCTIDGTTNNGLAGFAGNGLKENFPASHHNQYLYNIVHNFTERGIWLNGQCHNDLIQGNTIYNISGGAALMGIDLDGYQHCQWEHVVRNNIVYSCSKYGIELENCWACTIDSNTIYNCTTSAIHMILYTVTTLGGDANQYGINGDSRGMDTNTLVKNNLMYSCQNGVWIYCVNQVFVYSNTITLCTVTSIRQNTAAYCTHNEIKNNIFAGFPSDVGHSPDGQIVGESTLNSFTVDNNNLLETPHFGATFVYNEFNAWSHNSLAQEQAAYPALGVNSIQGSPVFVNAANNFHLQAGSPARGAAVAIPGIDVDRDGVARITNDMGCYQFV